MIRIGVRLVFAVCAFFCTGPISQVRAEDSIPSIPWGSQPTYSPMDLDTLELHARNVAAIRACIRQTKKVMPAGWIVEFRPRGQQYRNDDTAGAYFVAEPHVRLENSSLVQVPLYNIVYLLLDAKTFALREARIALSHKKETWGDSFTRFEILRKSYQGPEDLVIKVCGLNDDGVQLMSRSAPFAFDAAVDPSN